MFGFGKKSVENINTLSDIVRGMQYAVNTAQEAMERHCINMFAKYFDKDNRPLTTSFRVSETEILEVPLIALAHPSALKLDEMTVEMSIHINEMRSKTLQPHIEGADATRSCFKISLASGSGMFSGRRSSNVVDVVMKFKAGDPPEAASRILDEFTKQILPQKIVMQQNPTAPAAPDIPATES